MTYNECDDSRFTTNEEITFLFTIYMLNSSQDIPVCTNMYAYIDIHIDRKSIPGEVKS